MATIATGQVTIVDYNDAIALQSVISSNLSRSVIYSSKETGGSYVPTWSVATPLVLTPSLVKAGSLGTDLIASTVTSSQKWYYQIDGGIKTLITTGTGGYTITAGTWTLKMETNILATNASITYFFECQYQDPNTLLNLSNSASIPFTKVESGIATIPIATTPSGNVFKNSLPASLPCTCVLWRGATPDNTVTYQWFQDDVLQLTDVGAGIGWKLLTNVASVTTGVGTATLTVFPNAVTNIATFKCKITDSEGGGGPYYDSAVVLDYTDPYYVEVTSNTGLIFKPGVSEGATLTATLYQNGAVVSLTGKTVSWARRNSAGTVVNFASAPTTGRTGATITITGADVDVKDTFVATVTM